MKKLFLAVLLLLSVTANAQLVHEHTYTDAEAYETPIIYYLEGIGCTYLAVDKANDKINLYDNNHNLWKSFDAKTPSGYIIQRVRYASTKLFDLDSAIEVAAFYENGSINKIQIVDESGSVLNTIDYGYDATIQKFDNSWKFIVYNRGPNINNHWHEVYSLPGNFMAIKGPNTNNNDPVSAVFYPNPMDNVATLEYSLPKGEQKGTVQIYSNNGTVIRTYPINQNAGSLLIQRDGLPSGAYYITTTSDGVPGTAKKIVMN